jgi:hypothetical protein
MKKSVKGMLRGWKKLPSSWQQSIVTGLITLMVAVVALGGWWAATAIALSATTLLLILVAGGRLNDEIQPVQPEDLPKRLGVGLSTYIKKEHLDDAHKYLLLERIDMLDYSSGNYFSIRRIRGVNVSEGTSFCVPYVEASERRCSFFDCRVRAFDTNSKRELRVQPFIEGNEKEFLHAFRIFFEQGIEVGKEFDIVYSIVLPGELDDLKDSNEIMSIFLGRIKQGIDELRFTVAWNFCPLIVHANCRDKNDAQVPIDGTLSQSPNYVPSSWYAQELGATLCGEMKGSAMLVVKNPRYPQYIVKYGGM